MLEPERLCLPVTRESWTAYAARRDGDSDLEARFNRQQQISQYFLAELNLLIQMCRGRSYNCISWIESSFPYVPLVGLAGSPLLPSALRAACLDLLRVLYLDRFPQQKSCGRPAIPEQLWVYEEGDHAAAAAAVAAGAPAKSGGLDREATLTATPFIKHLALRPVAAVKGGFVPQVRKEKKKCIHHVRLKDCRRRCASYSSQVYACVIFLCAITWCHSSQLAFSISPSLFISPRLNRVRCRRSRCLRRTGCSETRTRSFRSTSTPSSSCCAVSPTI